MAQWPVQVWYHSAVAYSHTFIIWLVFQGQYMQSGSRLVDFLIPIGDAECVPVSLTDTKVTCEPPRTRPPIDVNVGFNYTLCPNDTLPTDVCIGLVYSLSHIVQEP